MSTPFPIKEVVGRPPMLSRMAFIIDMPGDRCSSEYTALQAMFHKNRLSGQRCWDSDLVKFQWARAWAYKQAISAGDTRSLLFSYCRRNRASSSRGKQGLSLPKYLVRNGQPGRRSGGNIWRDVHVDEVRYLGPQYILHDFEDLSRGAPMYRLTKWPLLNLCKQNWS